MREIYFKQIWEISEYKTASLNLYESLMESFGLGEVPLMVL